MKLYFVVIVNDLHTFLSPIASRSVRNNRSQSEKLFFENDFNRFSFVYLIFYDLRL